MSMPALFRALRLSVGVSLSLLIACGNEEPGPVPDHADESTAGHRAASPTPEESTESQRDAGEAPPRPATQATLGRVVTQGGVFEVGLSFDGRVRRLLTAVGERVEEGQVIAEVEAPTLAIAAAEAQALGSQQRVLAEQRERLAVLVAEGLESRDGLDSVLTTLAELETRRAAGTAILRTAHMQGADRAHLARRGVVRVRAPRAGVLVELMVPEGGAVGISAPLARLVAPSDAVVQVETAQRPPAGPARILTSQGAVTSQPSEGSVMDPATGLFLTFYPLRIPLPHGERVTVRFGVGHD